MSSLRCTYSGGGDYHLILQIKGGEALNVHSLYVHAQTDIKMAHLEEPLVRCVADTRQGARCRRRTRNLSHHCWQHERMLPEDRYVMRQ